MNVNGARRDHPLPGIGDDAVAVVTSSLDVDVFQHFGQVFGRRSGECNGKRFVRAVSASADEREAQGSSALAPTTDAAAKADDRPIAEARCRIRSAHDTAGLRPTRKANGHRINRLRCRSPHNASRVLSSATTGSAPCSSTYRPVADQLRT